MKKTFLSVAAATALIITSMASCSTQRANVTFDQNNTELAGNWYLVKAGTNQITEPVDGQWPHIEFNTIDATISGNVGCNQLMGNFTYNNKGDLKFERVASTRMMCPDMTVEDEVNRALPQVRHYTFNRVTSVMAMTGEKGDTLLKFMRINPQTLLNYRQVW